MEDAGNNALDIWSLGIHDVVKIDETDLRDVPVSQPTRVPAWDEMGGVVTAPSTVPGGGPSGIVTDVSEDTFEFARLLIMEPETEERGTRDLQRDQLNEGSKFVRGETEKALMEYFVNQTTSGGTLPPDRAKAERLFALTALSLWNNDPPEGFEMPEIIKEEAGEDEATFTLQSMRQQTTAEQMVAPAPMEADAEEQGNDALPMAGSQPVAAENPDVASLLRADDEISDGSLDDGDHEDGLAEDSSLSGEKGDRGEHIYCSCTIMGSGSPLQSLHILPATHILARNMYYMFIP